MTITRAQLRALRILHEHGPLRPREFAKLMWPESSGWMRPCKSGNKGTHVGGGMYLAGGAYLGRLRRDGLARYSLHGASSISGVGQQELDAIDRPTSGFCMNSRRWMFKEMNWTTASCPHKYLAQSACGQCGYHEVRKLTGQALRDFRILTQYEERYGDGEAGHRRRSG